MESRAARAGKNQLLIHRAILHSMRPVCAISEHEKRRKVRGNQGAVPLHDLETQEISGKIGQPLQVVFRLDSKRKAHLRGRANYRQTVQAPICRSPCTSDRILLALRALFRGYAARLWQSEATKRSCSTWTYAQVNARGCPSAAL